jgi:uncharacterized protein (TIGR03435 family)
MKVLGVLALALSLGLPLRVRAQAGELPRFDVASVKVSAQPFLAIAATRSGGRIQWTTDLWYVLGYAYRLQPWQISGPVPGSVSIYAFELVTTADATDDQVRLMFQSLLIDRFKMTFHRMTKEVDGYALTVAKGGPKMEKAKDAGMPPLPEWVHAGAGDAAKMEGHVVSTMSQPYIGNIVGRRVTMSQLSEALQRITGTAVFDRTGLTGSYYFAFEYAQENAPPEITVPNLFAAVKDIGLKLEKQRGSVETLVVDHIEKIPAEN